MRMWILWSILPLTGICQTDWGQLVQPSSILQFKSSQTNPFSSTQSYSSLAFIDSSTIGISIDNRYSIKSLSTLNISSQFKTHNGGWGFHTNCIGNEMFNGAMISTSYGIKISKSFGLGLGTRFRRDQLKGFSPIYIMLPQLGVLYFFSKNMSIGFQIKKLFRASIKSEMLYKEIASINTGIGYQVDENFYFAAEISNQFRQKSALNIYAEWRPNKSIKTYLNYQHATAELLGGLDYRTKKVNIGFGMANHSYLGNSGFLMMYHVL